MMKQKLSYSRYNHTRNVGSKKGKTFEEKHTLATIKFKDYSIILWQPEA